MPLPGNRLDPILQSKRLEIEKRRGAANLAALEAAARSQVRRPFIPALVRHGRSVIAEMKRSSPSRGVLREDFDPAKLARAYHAAGARTISVLTDGRFFGGALEHLGLARAACPAPLLQKDFLLDEFQVLEAAAAGADAVLLIAAALAPSRLAAMLKNAKSWGLDVLVEVHNEEELDSAWSSGATLVGVNNRDLQTFEVNLETSVRLAPMLKAKRTLSVSESGLRSSEDLTRLEALGYRAFLVGEQLVTSPDPGAALAALLKS